MRIFTRPKYLGLALIAAGVTGWLVLQWSSRMHKTPAADSTVQPTQPNTPSVGVNPVSPPSLPASAVQGPPARQVLALASALPPDFQADVLLRLADAADAPTVGTWSNRRDASIALAQQAHALAAHAARRLPGLASIGYVNDENEDELRSVWTNGLDQLSLQTRAILIMAKVAPERVPQMRSALPKPENGTCDSNYLDDPSPAYTLAAQLQPQEIRQRAAFIVEHLDAARRETDVAPALKMILAFHDLDAAGQTRVAESLASMFDRIRGNDPGFTATEMSVASDMPLVVKHLDLDKVPAIRNQLHTAYRNYIAAHFGQARCAYSRLGEHLLLEQRFVAELPDNQAPKPAPPTARAESENDTAVSLIRQAGFNIRTQLLENPGQNTASDPALMKASNEFLNQITDGPLGNAAISDPSGYIQRAQLLEILRYLQYAPTGTARDRGFAMLNKLLISQHYQHNHDIWFGDLKQVADQSQRWPDRTMRLHQMEMAASQTPIVKVYAMLMQRGQFP